MFMFGAVNGGLFGQRSSWTALDRDDNLVSSVGIGEYYAVMASFLGITPSDVLPLNPTPVAGIV